MTKEEIFFSRPFKTRNADEYDLEQVLNLFVDPVQGLSSPFDYENSIVKGRMGSGKTMYLRANHAFYLYGIVPSLLAHDSEIILPVMIQLNNFQHLREPSEIYRSVIIKIIEEITSLYIHLLDASKLAELHSGIKGLSSRIKSTDKLSMSIKQLSKLGSDEYLERITSELGSNGELKNSFLSLSAKYRRENMTEIHAKPNPGIKDVEECYKNLLKEKRGKILLLIDEAGSLDSRFFTSEGSTTPFFEILMNQFRTASFIRTKIAVYPNSYSDMLTETRYGDIIKLENSVKDQNDYQSFRENVTNIIHNYLNRESEENKFCASEFFEVSNDGNDAIEQIMFASNGNIRRLINLLDLSMAVSYKNHPDDCFVTKDDAINAIIQHTASTESLFTKDENIFLQKIVDACKARSAFRFRFPSMSPVIYKYTNKSEEFNIINIDEIGSGRRGNSYSFDYAYCVSKNIPTHYLHKTERIDRERSYNTGTWITRITQLNQEILEQSELPGKIDGEIEYFKEDSGFVKSDEGDRFFFMVSYVIDSDKHKSIMVGKRLRFYPGKLDDTNMAINIEVL